MKLGDGLFYRTTQKREKYAREVFDIDQVRRRIFQVSDEGIGELRLKQSRPITLQLTEPAKHLTNWLGLNAIRYDWRPTAQKAFGMMIEYRELHLEWAPCLVTVVEGAAANKLKLIPVLNDLAKKRNRALSEVRLIDMGE